MGLDTFEDKVAVITGGGSGIGYALAAALAERGARLVLGDIQSDALAAAVASLEGSGADVIGVQGDVSSAEDVERLARTAMDRFGAIHLAVNNAGVGTGGPMWEIDLPTWEWVLGVDLWGVIHGVRTFTPLIIESGGGHIVNTASMAGLTSVPFMGPYNVAKHGVVTLSETLHHELAMLHPEVGVTVVCPGWVNTKIHESERNRPEGVESRLDRTGDAGSEGPGAAMSAVVSDLISSGLDPADVASRVLDAVLAGKVYVVTHEGWSAGVTRRAELIVEGEAPELIFPSND